MGVIDRVIVGVGLFAVLVLAAMLIGAWVRKVGASMGEYCQGCGGSIGPTRVKSNDLDFCSTACVPASWRAPRRTA